MIVGYARCSTAEQNLDLQLDALKAAGCERIYQDVASGAKVDRPELEKCLKFLQRGDALVVWKLDRLGRTLHQLVNIIHDFSNHGIGFKVTTAPIDTTTAQGRMIFGVFASLAEFERELIKERIAAGIVAAKSRGVKFGPPSKITPEMLASVGSCNIAQKAKELGVSRSGLYRAMQGMERVG